MFIGGLLLYLLLAFVRRKKKEPRRGGSSTAVRAFLDHRGLDPLYGEGKEAVAVVCV